MLGDERKPLIIESIWPSDEKIFAAEPKNYGPRNDRARSPGNVRKSGVGSAVITRGVNEHPLPVMVWLGGHSARMGGPALCPQGDLRGRAALRQRNYGVALFPLNPHWRGRPTIRLDAGPGRAATQKWLDRHMETRPKCWPSEGRGLNPLDYSLWSQERESIWADKPAAMLELRTSTLRHLAASPDEKNRRCVAPYPTRCRLCIVARQGDFEKNEAETL